MNLQELSPNNAMIAGSEFWVIPDASRSSWVKKLDWYCNFQLKKTEFKELKFLSEKVHKISKDEDYAIKDIRCDSDAPVLIIGSGFVPCKYLVQLKFRSAEEWMEQVQAIKTKLKSQSLRIFLPQEIKRDVFFQLADKHFSNEDDISFVFAN